MSNHMTSASAGSNLPGSFTELMRNIQAMRDQMPEAERYCDYKQAFFDKIPLITDLGPIFPDLPPLDQQPFIFPHGDPLPIGKYQSLMKVDCVGAHYVPPDMLPPAPIAALRFTMPLTFQNMPALVAAAGRNSHEWAWG